MFAKSKSAKTQGVRGEYAGSTRGEWVGNIIIASQVQCDYYSDVSPNHPL